MRSKLNGVRIQRQRIHEMNPTPMRTGANEIKTFRDETKRQLNERENLWTQARAQART